MNEATAQNIDEIDEIKQKTRTGKLNERQPRVRSRDEIVFDEKNLNHAKLYGEETMCV